MHCQCSPSDLIAHLRGQCGRLAQCALPQRTGHRPLGRPQAGGRGRDQAHPQRRRSDPHGQSQRRTQPDALLRGLRVQAEHEAAVQRANDHLQARRARVLTQAGAGRVHHNRLRRHLGEVRIKQPRADRRPSHPALAEAGRERRAGEAAGPAAGGRPERGRGLRQHDLRAAPFQVIKTPLSRLNNFIDVSIGRGQHRSAL